MNIIKDKLDNKIIIQKLAVHFFGLYNPDNIKITLSSVYIVTL